MATISKRMTKSGVTYRIQVKVMDKGSGIQKTHSTTWKPLPGMTQRQIDREVAKFADEYERDIKTVAESPHADGVSPDITLGEYAWWWIERRKEELSASYYVNCKSAITEIEAHIGRYKMREISPVIIQRFYDQLDKKERTVVTVIAKPTLPEAMKDADERNIKYRNRVDKHTRANVMAGKSISINSAEKLSKALGCNVNSLFAITKTQVPYAYESIHKIKRTLRAMLSHAKKQRIINDNYARADYIDFPKRPPREIDYMNDDDAKKFYAAADEYPDIRYKTAALLLLLTGIRRGEMAGLEWSNINFEEATITIERSVTTVKGIGVVEKDPKTESSKRIISISDKLISTLKEYKEWYEQYKADVGDAWTGTDRLFIAECGKRFYPGTTLQWVHKICDAAGLPHRNVHSLRHTNITMQIAAGVPLVTVAGRAGHARTSTTTDIYSHFLKSSDKTAAEKIEQIFE